MTSIELLFVQSGVDCGALFNRRVPLVKYDFHPAPMP